MKITIPPEKRASYNATYRAKHRDALHASCAAYYAKHREERASYNAAHYIKCRDRIAAINAAPKTAVLEHYGWHCSCCGEKRWGFLTIDHINRDGAGRRKQEGFGASLYWWIIDHDFPNDLRVLCFNCNISRRGDGYCEHEGERMTTTARFTQEE